MSIHSASMLVKMTVRYWDGFKKDRRVSESVDATYQTAGNAGNYNKRLLSKDVLAPIYGVCNRIRYDHKYYTIPWCYDGVDLLPSKLYFEYTNTMRAHKDAFDTEVANLVQQYPIHKANQATMLGSMFNPEDYPRRDELALKFGLAFQFFPVPEEGHFVVDLEVKETNKLKKELGEVLANAQSEALGKLYARVVDLLEHMHERLADPGNVFRDSLVVNFVQLAQVLPGLNIFDDPKLNNACISLQNLAYIDSATLRKDEKMRAKVADAVYDIINELKDK